VEAGKVFWKDIIRKFYSGFEAELAQAEKDLDGERIKIPVELSDEYCDLCGKQMVIKSGRFGRFLACPGYPECTFTKPIVIEMPGRCPKCGSRILKKTSKRGYTYYGCERNNAKVGIPCDFMTWDVPVKDNCPTCGMTMFKKSGRGAKKPFCINESCPDFLPEELRPGYRKPKTDAASQAAAESLAEGAPPQAEEAKPAKKTTKKASSAKTAAKKPAAKKTAAAKKTTTKKTAAASTAKKATTKKAATKKSTAKDPADGEE
jgi:DNA topoisomerase-1